MTAPSVKVGARDIDAMTGHLYLKGNTDTVSLRKLVEGQMDRLEIEVTSKLVDTYELFRGFKPLADTQLPAKCALDSLEDSINSLQPLLLLVMDRRCAGHFLCE